MHAIDRGNARSIGDSLQLTCGVKNANQTAALITSICILLFRSWHQKVKRLTTDQVADILDILRGDIEAVLELINASRLRAFAPAAIPAALVIACQKHRKEAMQFCQRLISGAGLDEQSPILALRNAILGGKSFGGGETERSAAMYLVLGRVKEYLERQPPKPHFRQTALIYSKFFSPEFEEQLAAILELQRERFDEVEINAAPPPEQQPAQPGQIRLTKAALDLVHAKDLSDRANARAARNGL